MSLTSDMIRGHTETIILAQLAKGDSYGYEINKNVQALSDNEYELKDATLYSVFRRLEENGCICSYWGGEVTGARRRYYTITENGRKLYSENLEKWKQSKRLIDELIS